MPKKQSEECVFMSHSDNATALAENKVLILYILDQLPEGMLEDGLYKMISSINDVNYFYFKPILTDLVDSKLVGIYTKDEEEPVLKITSEGRNALSLTKDVLPGILKLKADNVFKEELSSITEETSVIAEFIPKNENDYTIKCKIVENNETIFEVRTFAGSRERAKRIVDHWKQDASSIYPRILDILLDNK
jgi:predicted transcriptional regulator